MSYHPNRLPSGCAATATPWRNAGLVAVLLGLAASLPAAGVSISARSAILWHDNITNADRTPDQLSATETNHEVTAARRWSAGRHFGVVLAGNALAEAWPRYDGLDRAAFGLRLAAQKKTGFGADSTVFGFAVSGDRFAAREVGRAGLAGSASFSVRRRFASWAQIRLAQDYVRYDAREHAFDRTARDTRLQFSGDFDGRWTVTATLARRDGGVLSYARPPHPQLVREGKALTTVTTFDADRPFIAYYFLARTLTARGEISRTLALRSSLTLALERRHTSHGVVDYRNHVVSLHVAHSF